MKFHAVFLTLGLMVCASCSKETAEESINLKVAPNTSLMYSLGYFSAADRLEFVTQAENARQSAIEMDAKTGEAFYLYRPTANFRGCEYIEISTKRAADEEFKILKLHLKVKDRD